MTYDLLDVHNLETRFKTPEGVVHAVNGVSLSSMRVKHLGWWERAVAARA